MANSQPSISDPRMARGQQPPDLVLFGESSFIQSKQPDPDITDYNGPLYQHNFEATCPRILLSDGRQSAYGLETQTQLLNHYGTSPNETSDFTGAAQLGGRQGFFNPTCRPPSGKMMRPPSSAVSDVDGTVARPNSVVSMLSRPQSVLGRPPSGIGRPASANRSFSRAGKRSVAGNVDSLDNDNVDPDHEPIADVLSRLDEYTQNFTPSVAVACIDCTCEKAEPRVSSRMARVYSSDSNNSDSDEDDEGVSFDVLLKTCQQYEEKGHSIVRQKAMMTLVNSYTSTEVLTEQQFKQMMVYVTTSLTQVQEACLALMKQSIRNDTNLQKLLDNRILDFLYDCLCQQPMFHMRKSALAVTEAIFLKPDYRSDWEEVAVVKFIPKLISLVRGQMPLDVKYAACCVFRALATYEDFIVFMTEEILPCVLQMRNASAKFKEVYVEILTGVISHTEHVPSDLTDSSAIPVTSSIIREGPCGPQCAAIHLLTTLTTNDTGIAMVMGTSTLVPMLLCCMKESHCRKVRLVATEVVRNMCTSRKLGLCKDFMLQLSSYLVPSLEYDSLTSLSKMAASGNMPARPHFDEERQMWLGLEKFVEMTKAVIFREAKVEVDDPGLVSKIHMKPCIDTCPIQLGLISHAFQILQYVCLWPLDKSRLGFSANRVDLTTFTDDEIQRTRLSKVNRGLTQSIWDKVGSLVTELLFSYADKFSRSVNEPIKWKQSCSLDKIFEPQEVTLIKSLLELILCSSLCTCVAFPELMPKLEEKKSKKKSKSSKLKSHSTTQMADNRCSHNIEARLKSQSDTGKGFQTENDKLWVRENPYLTNMHSNNTVSAKEKSKAELQHKEACTDRRLLRKCLYEADVFRCVCPFLFCSEANVQILVLQILRCLIQPLEERVAPRPSFTVDIATTGKTNQRPQTAGATQNTNRRLNMALYKMSPDLAGLIKEALGPQVEDGSSGGQAGGKRSPLGKTNILDIPGTDEMEAVQERLQEYAELNKDQDSKAKKSSENDIATPCRRSKPVIDRSLPIAQQCREALLEGMGEKLVMGIFTKSQMVKKHFVYVLHDFVHFGEPSTNMDLAKYGCMPRLLDFLRVNENNELLEIIGLIIVRLLVASDSRLKQLFNRHGGPQLLLSMVQYTNGLLKQEVATTLKSVSKVETVKRRPVSAPVTRTTEKQRAPDIWDHIQARWRQEDQVTKVLRQWIVEDQKHRMK